MLSLQRNGYTSAQVDAQLHSPVVEWHFRYDLLDKSNVFKKTLTTVISGHVGYDTSQKIRRTAKLTMQDDSSVNFLSDRIQPHALLKMPNASYPTVLSYAESTQPDFVSGTLTNVIENASGLQLSNVYGPDPATSLTGWTNTGVVIDAISGNPGSCYKAIGGTYAYRNVGIGPNMTLELDVQIISGTTDLCDIFLMCDPNGNGQMFRLDARGGVNYTGFASTTSWSTVNPPSSGGTVSAGTWHHVKIIISSTTMEGFVDGVSFGTYTFANNGGYIAVQGGGSVVTGGLFDNIVIDNFDTSGSRTSGPINLSSLGTIQSSTVSWSANTPANTSVSLQASTDGGTTWNNLTNGGSLVNGNPTSVMLRENLSTTDTSQTPTLQNVTVSVTGSIPGGWVDFPLGVFILSTPPRQTDPAQAITRQIDAYDLLQVLVDDKVATRYTVTSGTKYTDAIKTILTGAGFTSMNIQDDPRTLPASLDWAPGTEKLEIINALGTAINYRGLWMDENGVPQGIPYQSPSVRTPDYTYIDDDKSVMFPDMSQQLDLFAVPNEWVLVVTEPDQSVITSTYTNSNPNSPTSTVNRGRTIVKYDTSQLAPDQASLDSLASKMAYTDSQVYEQVEFYTAISPYHSDFDVINLVYSTLGISDKYSETAWEFDLAQGARMRHVVRKVVSV